MAEQDIVSQKRALRTAAEQRRSELSGAARARQSADAAQMFARHVDVPEAAIVSAYWPIGSECDPRPLMRRLHAAGHKLCLPVVLAPRQPLVFRRWEPGATLVTAAFGVQIPEAAAPELVPDVLIVPMLAFDDGGVRLGYGGGFYDRTLAQLRRHRGGTLAVGYAFEQQHLPVVPRNDGDEILDCIVTDARFRHI